MDVNKVPLELVLSKAWQYNYSTVVRGSTYMCVVTDQVTNNLGQHLVREIEPSPLAGVCVCLQMHTWVHAQSEENRRFAIVCQMFFLEDHIYLIPLQTDTT